MPRLDQETDTLREQVSIAGVQAETKRGVGVVRVLLSKDGGGSRRPLSRLGPRALRKRLFQLMLPDRTGEVSRLLRNLAEEGVVFSNR